MKPKTEKSKNSLEKFSAGCRSPLPPSKFESVGDTSNVAPLPSIIPEEEECWGFSETSSSVCKEEDDAVGRNNVVLTNKDKNLNPLGLNDIVIQQGKRIPKISFWLWLPILI